MAFYIRDVVQYHAMKSKCPPGTYIQPITVEQDSTFAAVRGPAGFMPAEVNVYYGRDTVYRVTIDKLWLPVDLYQLCDTGKKVIIISLHSRKSQ